ncbi:MAG: 3-dehydroquinate synthase [Saprospiraceae bacterium]|jgi:3-dehydroquinate synthase
MRQIQLSNYNVEVGPIRESLQAFLKGNTYTSITVIVDENTEKHCLLLIASILPEHHLVTITSGEEHKTLATCEQIWGAMAANKVDRHGLVINLGGGVIGDMGGFVASTYMRGLDFIQIPTTLLSQVDASVGGKLGVDFNGLKNFIGLFQNPKAVLVDPNFINTLTPEDHRSGYAEMIKHAMIRDRSIWDRLTKLNTWRDMDQMEEIYESIQIKKDVVSQDPREGGLRKILNFGHTIGHAVETLSFSTDHPYLHGEAIGIGMAAEALLSVQHCGLPKEDAEQISSYLNKVYDGLDLSILSRHEEIIELLHSDKKNKGGKLQFSLLKEIGNCTWDISVSLNDIKSSIDDVQSSWK